MTTTTTRLRRLAAWVVLAVVAALPVTVRADASSGEANFNALCAACHTIGGGRRVGPDLKDVSSRYTEAWLIEWIASSQTLVNKGDPKAKAIFDEYKVPMPDTHLSAAEIRDIITYIGGGAAAEVAPEPAAPPATPEVIAHGEALFQGQARFQAGGPACASCHHVTHDAVIGGGVLAKELTTSYERLGGPGLHAILSAPPFPVMARAFNGRALTDDEVTALVGYLQSVGGPARFDQPREDALKLLGGGVGGLVFLMCLYAVLWRRRKKYTVNAAIFDRQLKTR